MRTETEPTEGPTVLIGTAESVADLARQLACLGLGEPIGCVLTGTGAERSVAGLPVLGRAHEIEHLHRTLGIGLAVVSLPLVMDEQLGAVREALARLGVDERVVPPLRDLLASVPQVPDPPAASTLDLAALIGREPYGIDRRSVALALERKRVLITGAGGSIGSELARICATFGPELLILMERSENALFEVDRQITAAFPDTPRKALLHDVVDADETRRQLDLLRPHAVFHAAAHKHVPLMEDHPAAALTNNLFGTKSVADASISCGVERFVMISTDKAVNPRSVMGATKRLAELYVQHLAASGKGKLCMVRFGNVLGSTGSVLTIWDHQLAEGGPISVTDARMTRYFMTIPEAASLVVQAGALDGGRGEVYVLDMGEPVGILELAERFVRMHGFDPRVVRTDNDLAGWLGRPGSRPVMDICLTGVRPGEKLTEQLAYEAEELTRTGAPGISTLASPAKPDPGEIRAMLGEFQTLRAEPDRDRVLGAIRRHIPTLRPDAEVEPAPERWVAA